MLKGLRPGSTEERLSRGPTRAIGRQRLLVENICENDLLTGPHSACLQGVRQKARSRPPRLLH
jgi:hypothetical protein